MKFFCLSLICLIISSMNLQAQTGSWKQLGPPLAGRFSGIVASPADQNLLVASSPGGGIFRSTNGGANWTQTNQQILADNFVLRLHWDKIIKDRIYAVTFSDLYMSSDAGINWKNLTGNGGLPAKELPEKLPDYPAPFCQLILPGGGSVICWSKPGFGIYYSVDGITFKQHFPFSGGSGNPDNMIHAICADDATGRIYIAPLSSHPQLPAKLYRSTCAWLPNNPCLSWEAVQAGLPTGGIVSDIVWAKAANRLMLGIQGADGTSSEVYTTLNGTNWQKNVNLPPHGTQAPRLLAISSNLIILGSVSMLATADFGLNWTKIFFGQMHPDIRCLYYAAYPGGGKLWAGTDGTSNSNDYFGLVRWNCDGINIPSGGVQVPTTGIRTWQVYSAAVITAAGNAKKKILASSQDNASVGTDNNGLSWEVLSNKSSCGDIMSVVVAPSDPNRAYMIDCNSADIHRSDNALSAASPGSIIWDVIPFNGPKSFSENWSNAMFAVSPTNASLICLAGYFTVMVSKDGGNNWTASNLPNNARPTCVMIDVDQWIYAGTRGQGIFRSIDAGKTWIPFAMTSAGNITILKLAHTTAGGVLGTFYAATSKGLYRKQSEGAFQFVPAVGDSTYAASDVEIDPLCPNRIYVSKGYWFRKKFHRGGIMVSHNNGNTFSSITAGYNIHQSPITDIQIDPTEPRYIYAATYGAGVWRYDAGTLPPCQ